jgi:hypothetical protein
MSKKQQHKQHVLTKKVYQRSNSRQVMSHQTTANFFQQESVDSPVESPNTFKYGKRENHSRIDHDATPVIVRPKLQSKVKTA